MKKSSQYSTQVLLTLGCILLFSFIIFPCFSLGKKQKDVQSEDSRLKVVNYDLMLDDTIVLCHFVPVVGGEMDLGGINSFHKTMDTTGVYKYKRYSLHSFLIAEVPVSDFLWMYVMMNTLGDINQKTVLLEDDFLLYYYVPIQQWQYQAFINKLNKKTGRKFRLPTNEEWEYAARGGVRSNGYKYSGSDDISEVCIYQKNCEEYEGQPQGKKKKPNELGLFDMSGCVWELTSTYYKEIHHMHKYAKETGQYDFNDTTDVKVYQFFESLIVRGGDLHSSMIDCSLDRLPIDSHDTIAVRLVLEY